MDGLGELARVGEVGMGGLPPQHVGVLSVGEAPGDAGVHAVAHAVEALRRAFAVDDEGAVALVDVAGQQLGGLRVGAGDDQGGRAHHVGGEARGDQVALMRGGGD